jgi:phosphoserine phosphatase RsbU/P
LFACVQPPHDFVTSYVEALPIDFPSFKLSPRMRDKIGLVIFLLGAALLLYVGRGLVVRSALATGALTFAGTTAAAVLGMALYRVQLELRATRHELAREQAELGFAREVQQALFPREFPADGGLEFVAVCVPATGISGDYYDVMLLRDRRLVFAIADISGKGISAAILMSNVHAVLRTLAEAGHSPVEICSQLNRHLYRITEADRFATLFYAEWNPAERCLSYVNAGHPPPILRGSNGSRRLEEGGVPLGLFLGSEFQMGRIVLQPGDLIALYSDGITEAGTGQGEQFGESRLEALLRGHSRKPLTEIHQQVLAAVREWSGREPEDDMTLLLVRATDGV